MKIVRKFFLIIVFLIGITKLIYAGPGSDNMLFLKYSPSVLANSLADSTVSFPMDVNNMFYNPAGAYTPSFFNVGFSYTLWFQSINFFHFAGKMKITGIGNVGVGFVTTFYDDIFKTEDRNGILVKTDNKLALSDYYFLLNYNNAIGHRFFFGANMKLAHNKIDISAENGFGGDVGFIYLLTDNISTGVSILNLGIGNMPMIIKAGAGYNKDLSETSGIIISGEVDKSEGAGIEGGAGLELKLMRIFFLRTGYRLSDAEGNFRIGAGIKYKSFQIDYSFNNYSDLGNVNRIGITFKLD